MAHNPPRIWMTNENYRELARAVSRKQAQWHSLDGLADKMIARAAQGKNVVLSPGTADYLARWVKDRCCSP